MQYSKSIIILTWYIIFSVQDLRVSIDRAGLKTSYVRAGFITFLVAEHTILITNIKQNRVALIPDQFAGNKCGLSMPNKIKYWHLSIGLLFKWYNITRPLNMEVWTESNATTGRWNTINTDLCYQSSPSVLSSVSSFIRCRN